MLLQQLEIHHFRNIEAITLTPSPSFNLFYGINGSGKTSILEAIHCLALGRSFRSRQVSRIIQHQQAKLWVVGQILDRHQLVHTAGIAKQRNSQTHIKIDGEIVTSAASLAQLLPLQLVNADSFQLLTAGPTFRRHYLDWGVFHVEPQFLGCWKRFMLALKQRNASLRASLGAKQVQIWDQEVSQQGESLAHYRRQYFETLKIVIAQYLAQFAIFDSLALDYFQGWDERLSLSETLTQNITKDTQAHYTQQGPHRADLRLRLHNLPVEEVLSRGEQKLLVYILSLAQAAAVRELQQKPCIYLLDDLPAELDPHYTAQLLGELQKLQSQVFITGIDLQALRQPLSKLDYHMFHVEQGMIK